MPLPIPKPEKAKRITIIPRIHGTITKDETVSEPDIQWIIEKWFEQHPVGPTSAQPYRPSPHSPCLIDGDR